MNFVQNIENWVKRTASLDNSLEGRRFAPFLDLIGITVLKSLKSEISEFICKKNKGTWKTPEIVGILIEYKV